MCTSHGPPHGEQIFAEWDLHRDMSARCDFLWAFPISERRLNKHKKVQEQLNCPHSSPATSPSGQEGNAYESPYRGTGGGGE